MGTSNVYICHIENLENEIKEIIPNFDINNSRHRDNKMKKFLMVTFLTC